MRPKLSNLGIGLAVFLPCASFAAGPGTTGGSILNIPVGARAIAMGEAYTAQADDVSSLYWNPAGVALLNQSQASFLFNQSLEDLTFSHMAAATPLEHGGIGASLSYLGYGHIDGYSESTLPTGNVDAHSAMATLGAAWLADNWSAGFTVKGLQGVLADEKATGFASDLGVTAIVPHEILGGTLRFAGTVRNLGTGLKYLEEKDSFNREFRLGTALVQLMDRRLNASLDYGKSKDNDGAVYMGAEYWLMRQLALRAGYNTYNAEGSGLRMGIGLKVKDVSFDYAFSSHEDFGMSHRYELTVRFGALRPLLSPEERRLMRQGKQAMGKQNYGEAVMLFDSLMQLQPQYKPAKKLWRTAMAGLQKQDALVRNINNYKYAPGQNLGRPDGNPDEEAEMEQLLNMANEATANAAGKAGAQ